MSESLAKRLGLVERKVKLMMDMATAKISYDPQGRFSTDVTFTQLWDLLGDGNVKVEKVAVAKPGSGAEAPSVGGAAEHPGDATDLNVVDPPAPAGA